MSSACFVKRKMTDQTATKVALYRKYIPPWPTRLLQSALDDESTMWQNMDKLPWQNAVVYHGCWNVAKNSFTEMTLSGPTLFQFYWLDPWLWELFLQPPTDHVLYIILWMLCLQHTVPKAEWKDVIFQISKSTVSTEDCVFFRGGLPLISRYAIVR